MGWRTVVITKVSKLDYKMGYLVVRTNESTNRIHLSEIDTLIMESTSISLTAYLLNELINNKINVIFCDQSHNPTGQIIPLYGSHDTSDKVRKQILWDENIKSEIWQSIVCHKILGQSNVLKKNAFESESLLLLHYLDQTTPGDTSNREGHAAKVYFNRLFGMNFSRNDKNNIINMELNYGYSILLSAVNREIISNGYITQLGIHHDNMFNEFNLACDVMEPFRPFIDDTVLSMPHDSFDSEEKRILANILNRRIRLDNKEQFLSNALSIYVKSVLDALTSGISIGIKYPDYELSIYESTSTI